MESCCVKINVFFFHDLCFSGYAKSNIFRGLEQNKTYRYRLRVSNDHGHSPWSQVITVTTTRK